MNAFKKNLGWIFFGNIVHAIFQFSLNVICARFFGSEDYGLINYSSSIIALFTTIGTLGFNGVITKYFAFDEKNAGKYLFSSIMARVVFAVISIAILQIILLFESSLSSTLRLIVLCQSLQLLFTAGDLFVYWFRYKSQAKLVACIRLLAFSVSAIWRLIAIYYFNSLIWYVLGVSIETVLFIIFLFYSFKKYHKSVELSFDKKTLMDLFKISYPFIFSAVLVTIYGQTDKIMLKSFVDYSAVGLYSVSLTLAGAIAIIPSALIEGFRPDIMTFKVTNKIIYRQRFTQLYGLVFWICVVYCLFITVFHNYIIQFLYGEQYIKAASSLAIIVWYTSFSYFGAINNLFMVAENKTKWVQVTTLFGALLNIALNFVLIPLLGIVGAALASLITQIVTNYLLLWFIKPLRECFYIMNDGIRLKGFNVLKRSM